MIASVPLEKGGRATNIHSYGYNKGFDHLYDTMKLILQDCDALLRSGKNVIMIAQSIASKVANPAGEDYLCDGPRLQVRRPSIESLYREWLDHLLRIDFASQFVSKEKKVSGDTERAIFTQQQQYFRAKTRYIKEPVVAYADPSDDSIWQYVFPERYEE
jgi:hypothetical protein